MVPIAVVVAAAAELGKLALQTYFQHCRMAGKTKEEMDELYAQAKDQFMANHPDYLPEVPPDS